MHTTRLLATSATAVVLALGLSACGADDDAVPASSTSSAGSQAALSPSTPSADAAQAQPGNDDHAYEVDVELGGDDDVTVEIAEDLSVVRVDR